MQILVSEMEDFLPKLSIYMPAMPELLCILSFHVLCALKFEHRFELYTLMYWL